MKWSYFLNLLLFISVLPVKWMSSANIDFSNLYGWVTDELNIMFRLKEVLTVYKKIVIFISFIEIYIADP